MKHTPEDDPKLMKDLVAALKMCLAVLSGEAMSKSTLIHTLNAARDVLKKIEDNHHDHGH